MQFFRFFSVFVLVVACLVLPEACVSHDFPEYTCTDAYSFSEDVRPIIETKCAIAGCHNGSLGEDLNWTIYQNFHQRAREGQVKFRVTHRIMPPEDSPAGPLSQDEINAIACWTDQGSLNN
jgi:hypothetical protein